MLHAYTAQGRESGGLRGLWSRKSPEIRGNNGVGESGESPGKTDRRGLLRSFWLNPRGRGPVKRPVKKGPRKAPSTVRPRGGSDGSFDRIFARCPDRDKVFPPGKSSSAPKCPDGIAAGFSQPSYDPSDHSSLLLPRPFGGSAGGNPPQIRSTDSLHSKRGAESRRNFPPGYSMDSCPERMSPGTHISLYIPCIGAYTACTAPGARTDGTFPPA